VSRWVRFERSQYNRYLDLEPVGDSQHLFGGGFSTPAYCMGEPCQISAKPEVYSGKNREYRDDEFWRQHALPCLHALLAKCCIRGSVLEGFCLRSIILGGIVAATTARCHDGHSMLFPRSATILDGRGCDLLAEVELEDGSFRTRTLR